MGTASRVAIITPMPSEARPVVRMLGLTRAGDLAGTPVYRGAAGDTGVVLTGTGIGPGRAGAATERLLAAGPVDRLIVCGIAGGLAPVSAVGDLILPSEVVDSTTGERFAATPSGGATVAGVIRMGGPGDYALDDADVARLVAEGFTALDMETAAIARVCAREGLPWMAFRAISDMAGDASFGPAIMELVNPDGSPRPWAAARYVATHPHRIPRMVRLGRDAQAAATAAARATVANLAQR